jgi:hypothetical protein
MYENGTMKPVETVLRKTGGDNGERLRWQTYLIYILSTFVNFTMYPIQI